MSRITLAVVLLGLSTVQAQKEEPPPPEAVASPDAQKPADDQSEAKAEAETQQIAVDPEIFDVALEDFYNKRYVTAASGFWGYIHFGEASAENYEWAQFFLAECLRHLGLWHAAVQYYYEVAKTRSRPEILPDALGRIEAISRTRPYSESLVNEDLIYDSEFGSLPPALTDWVEYVQGSHDLLNGFLDWSERHLSSVNKKSPYYLRGMYVKAVWALKHKREDEALAAFQVIVDANDIDAPDVKNKANLALARLLYDMGRYADALEVYNRVKQIDLSFEQAELLLEKAWTSYNLGDSRKAMGLLHALNAPSYERFFLPDAFLLRGLILKDLCHFIPAKRMVRAFRFKHNRAIDQLKRRLPLEQIKVLFDASTQEGSIARRTAFLRSLEAERKLIENYDSDWEDVELDKHLRQLYELEIREQTRLWRLEFEVSSDRVALELLESEEQVNLLDYEIGLDIFKRLKASEAKKTTEESLKIPFDSANVFYEFDTEFWNDELHSYKYFVSNRCFENEVKP